MEKTKGKVALLLFSCFFLTTCSSPSENSVEKLAPAVESSPVAEPFGGTSESTAASALDIADLQQGIAEGLPALLAEQSGNRSSLYTVYCPDRIPTTVGAVFSCEFDSDILYGDVTVTIANNKKGYTWKVVDEDVKRFTTFSDEELYTDYNGLTKEEILAILPDVFAEEWETYADEEKNDSCLYYGTDPYSASDDYAEDFLKELPSTLTEDQRPSLYQVKQLWEIFMEDICYTSDY